MSHTLRTLGLGMFLVLAPACGSGGSGPGAPDLSGEWWITTIASDASDGFLPSTSWGTATLSTEGGMSFLTQGNKDCETGPLDPADSDTGSTYSVDASGQVIVATSSGEVGSGYVDDGADFMTVGLVSEGSSPTLAALLRKEAGHTAATMNGTWRMFLLQECADALSACVGTIVFNASEGSYAYTIDCNVNAQLALGAVDDGTYSVGPDGSLTLTDDLAGMGGIGGGGNIAIAAGNPAGGNNTFVVMMRTSGVYSDADFNGDYHIVTYEFVLDVDPVPEHASYVGTITADGISAMALTGQQNQDGEVEAGSEPTGNTFNVLPSGELEVSTMGGDAVRGALLPGGGIGFVAGPLTAGADPLGGILIRK